MWQGAYGADGEAAEGCKKKKKKEEVVAEGGKVVRSKKKKPVCARGVSGRAQSVAANQAGTTVASTTALFFWSGVLDLFQMPLASEFATISLVCPFSKVKLILKVFLASREGTASSAGFAEQKWSWPRWTTLQDLSQATQ